MMEHLTKEGVSKLVKECTYPLTGLACVAMVFTDLGIFEITKNGFVVRELFNDMSLELVQSVTDALLRTDLTI
jgi:3-oxoadipate CoA-transferase beta subunit